MERNRKPAGKRKEKHVEGRERVKKVGGTTNKRGKSRGEES